MSLLLYLSAAAAFAIGLAHSVLGERYILVRLFRRGSLPKLLGSDVFTIRTLRFAWHLTTLAWWGFGALMLLLAQRAVSPRAVAGVIGVTFVLTGFTALVGSRGQHLSWPVFLFIGGACLFAALLL